MSSTSASTRTDPLGLIGQTIDDRYEVLELVDEGGYGFVYKARRVMWDKPVALKLFKQKSSDPKKREAATKAFIAEGAVLNELSRKTTAIVQSFDIGTTGKERGELLYMALEWLDGRDLAELIEAERSKAGGDAPWPIERIIDILQPAAVALAVAHASGVAHRDVKPANIFLLEATDSVDSTTKLVDFGVAKVVADLAEGFEHTGHQEGPYTPKYGAPEQFAKRHGSTGPWSDVYSLAMVCVELLVGRYPISADGFGSLIFAVCDANARPTPRQLGVEIPDALEDVFARALAVQSDQRYRDAGQFWRALLEAAGISASTFPVNPAGRIATMRNPPSFDAAFGSTGRSLGDITGSGTRTAPSRTDSSPPSLSELTAEPAARTLSPAPQSGSRVMALVAAAVVAASILGAVIVLRKPPPPAASSAAPVASPSASSVASATIDRERLASFGTLPEAIVSADNPLADAKIELGRMLYYDTRLSKGGDVSCNTCHALDNYGVDGKPVSTGTASQPGIRNSPTVYNAAGAFALMWDGRADTIEHQAGLPLTNPVEHGMTDKTVVEALEKIPGYKPLFDSAFPETKPSLTWDNVLRAIGAFERKLVTPSRWDEYLNGKDDAITEDERRGFNVFVDVGCPTCHMGSYVGMTMFQKLGLVRAWPDSKDRGRFEQTKLASDMMMFRVPSLRNVVETGPYFHDGSVSSLETAVRLMAKHQLGKDVSDPEVAVMVAWLGTLTGKIPGSYIEKPKLP